MHQAQTPRHATIQHSYDFPTLDHFRQKRYFIPHPSIQQPPLHHPGQDHVRIRKAAGGMNTDTAKEEARRPSGGVLLRGGRRFVTEAPRGTCRAGVRGQLNRQFTPAAHRHIAGPILPVFYSVVTNVCNFSVYITYGSCVKKMLFIKNVSNLIIVELNKFWNLFSVFFYFEMKKKNFYKLFDRKIVVVYYIKKSGTLNSFCHNHYFLSICSVCFS